ncbi:MAG TPA: hypothetical protein VGQ57_05315 [Polyangiaceae bacterium]|jgi:hypothetical protein|nr:hypothetical protein [Polyangiaceae bacterium]
MPRARDATTATVRRTRVRAHASAALLCTLLAAASVSAAGVTRARLFPTAVESAPDKLGAGNAGTDERLQKLAAAIDDTVEEGALDLGLLPQKAAGPPVPERALASLDPTAWIIAPRLSSDAEGVHVRLTAVAPGSRVELVREEVFSSANLSKLDVRTVVMLRDLYEAGSHAGPRLAAGATAPRKLDIPEAPPSSGRPALALNGAVLGGYFGFALEQASGSSDSRLVYPLVALGTGLGLGASLLVADEWNISSGEAWYLSAGMWWPLASGLFLAQSYGVKQDNAYLYGLVGAGSGLALASAAIATHDINEGGAVLTHSGGAFGALLGAITDATIQGTTGVSVKRGIGFGTGAGVLLGGALATQVNVTPSRVLLIDLAASLGTVGAAALASPLLVSDNSDPTRTRLWLASAGVGTIAGGAVGWWVTAPAANAAATPAAPEKASAFSILPYGSVLPSKNGNSVTLGVVGAF